MSDENLLVRVLRPACRRLLGFVPLASKVPQLRAGESAFVVLKSGLNGREVKGVDESEMARTLRSGVDCTVLSLCMTPQPLTLVFPGGFLDANKQCWDLTIQGTYTICDGSVFLEKFARDKVLPDSGLSRQITESWIANMLGQQVKQAVHNNTAALEKDKAALPVVWWSRQLTGWLSGCGVGLSGEVTHYEWKSEGAERAKAERRRMDDLERIRAEEARERESRILEARAQSLYEEEKRKIEIDCALSEKARLQQLETLEIKHRKELLDLEIEVENAQRARERATAEHEVYLAKLRNDQQAVGEAEIRKSEIAERERQVQDMVEKASEALNQLAKLAEPMLQRLSDADKKTQHQTIERLLSPEFGMTASQLSALGFKVGTQSLVESLRKKEDNDDKSVQLIKHFPLTRDIGASKVPGLPIGKCLGFKLSCQRSGYVTVLNLGTSGNVYVHVPSALIGGRSALAECGKTYDIPGPELFPWKWVYREEGPAGWEHMVAVISDEPLLDPTVLSRSTMESPLVLLDTQEVAGLFADLNSRDGATWSAGLLSFFVGCKRPANPIY